MTTIFHPHAPEGHRLEPIALTPFEHYMLADDRPSHSMTCHIRFWFRGVFNPDFFKKALAQVLPRHPVFQMTVVGSPRKPTRKIYWHHPGQLTMPFISWAAAEVPIDEPSGGFAQNIYKNIGLRFWIRDDQQSDNPRTMMLVQFHHSVCDGIGLFQFMEDLLIAYGSMAGVSVPPMRPIDPEAFFRRGDFGLTARDWAARRPIDVARAAKFFKSRARPLAYDRQKSASLPKTADLFASERFLLAPEVLGHLRSHARASNASVNDVMIHDLFHTLADWNRAHGDTKQDIRVAMATSLRGPPEVSMSAANVVSMVFLNRSHREIASQKLLASIVEETHLIKQYRLGVVLPRVIRRLGRYPGAIDQFLKIPICSATAVLTNLGRPFADSPLTGPDGLLRVGSLTLESLETMPPVRPKTSASISVNYYGGSLSVTLRYDSTVFSRQQAVELLGNFTARLSSHQWSPFNSTGTV
jgi:hypothetical protein